jgi:hypothetical protein
MTLPYQRVRTIKPRFGADIKTELKCQCGRDDLVVPQSVGFLLEMTSLRRNPIVNTNFYPPTYWNKLVKLTM